MSGSVRVHELAKELGTSSRQVISELKSISQFVKSASSLIDAPAAATLRAKLAGKVPEQRTRPTPSFMATPVMRRNCREWYRGPELSALTTMILDHIIIFRRVNMSYRPGSSSRYFADEVKLAQDLTAEWSGALFDGLTTRDIVKWMGLVDPPISARQAVVLHSGGITPADLDSHHADNGQPSLGFRLSYGNVTVEQIVIEVHNRRAA